MVAVYQQSSMHHGELDHVTCASMNNALPSDLEIRQPSKYMWSKWQGAGGVQPSCQGEHFLCIICVTFELLQYSSKSSCFNWNTCSISVKCTCNACNLYAIWQNCTCRSKDTCVWIDSMSLKVVHVCTYFMSFSLQSTGEQGPVLVIHQSYFHYVFRNSDKDPPTCKGTLHVHVYMWVKATCIYIQV